MNQVTVIPARQWRNTRTGATASIYGAVPYYTDAERAEWNMETVGWTWRRADGTVGLGRPAARTREEAEAVAARINARYQRS